MFKMSEINTFIPQILPSVMGYVRFYGRQRYEKDLVSALNKFTN